MGLLSIFKKKAKSIRRFRRSFTAAKIDRLTADWSTQIQSVEREIKAGLRVIRARARDAAKNDPYAKRFLSLLKTNVIGPNGINLQVRAKNNDGQLDTYANNLIEREFKKWGRRGVCTLDGQLSWIDCQNLFVETLARDGECLVRLADGWKGNRYGFALEFIDVDYLDDTFEDTSKPDRPIHMGIEYNEYNRPQFYYISKSHPAGGYGFPVYGDQRQKLKASEIIHAFSTYRAKQGRGISWFAPSLYLLKMLGGYLEAELVASRVSASKMGFFSSTDGEGYIGDDLEDFSPISEASPGTFDQLPAGVDLKSWDPEHPVNAFEAFTLAILRGISSGFDRSYVSIANDLRSVSYSSIRKGDLEDRDHYRTLQTFCVEHFHQEIFERWLKMALLTQAVKLPDWKFDKFNAPVWRPRGWAWVDPLKEVKANIEAVSNGFKSMQDVAGEQGRDIADVFEALQAEVALAEQYGLSLDILKGEEKP
jgi:lambda family phage portal protein